LALTQVFDIFSICGICLQGSAKSEISLVGFRHQNLPKQPNSGTVSSFIQKTWLRGGSK